MGKDSTTMTEWDKENRQNNIYIFTWNKEYGALWYSKEKNEKLLNCFIEQDGLSRAVEEGLFGGETKELLENLIQTGSRAIEHAEEVVLLNIDNRQGRYKVCINNTFDRQGACIGFLVNIMDLNEMTDVFQKMSYKADYDQLTDIYNVERFYQEVTRMLTNHPEKKYAIIRLDFDRFEVVNDLFGAEEGDRILKYVGKIFGSLGRTEICYCRVISDVFAICISYEKDDDIMQLLNEIQLRIAEYPVGCRLAPYFGIYKIVERDIPVSIMLDYAKLACRSIKGNVINNYSFYTESLRKQILNEVEIERDMEQALEDGQFKLFLQPKYDIESKEIIGAEALCRWFHPQKGVLSPASFIPLFERNGFVVKLDRYMWEETCKVIRYWLDHGFEVKPISLNVSRVHAHNSSFEETIVGLVEQYDIPSHLLELELTESAYLSDEESLYQVMNRLKERGLLFSVDDFGTGYSSLNMLKSIPVDVVKMDREFLSESNNDIKGKTIIRNIISLVNELDIRVIAEGVENVEQAELLLEMGCKLAQGYYYSRPLAVDVFEKKVFSGVTN